MRPPSKRPFFVALAAAAVSIGLVVAARLQTGDPIYTFTGDPLELLDAPPWTGFLSNLMILGWALGLGFAVMGRRVTPWWARSRRSLFTALAFLTSVLLVDDLFLIHDIVAPGLGVPEGLVLTLYVAAGAFVVVRFREELRATPWTAMVVAGGLMGASAAMDVVAAQEFTGRYLLEDGLKAIAVALWAAYLYEAAIRSAALTRQGRELPVDRAPESA